MKKCIKCGNTKSINEFGKDKHARDGFKSTCKECMKVFLHVCEECGKEFKSAERIQKYCSRDCYYVVNRRLTAERRNRKTVKCHYCGEKVTRPVSQFEGKERIYCSVECKDKGWGKYYKGENSPRYNPELTDEERIANRKYQAYYEWRENVYKRDKYTCRKCLDNKGGNLNAHHIYNYSEHEDKRTKLTNALTLCNECHKQFHDNYGYTNNNKKQLEKYLKQTLLL